MHLHSRVDRFSRPFRAVTFLLAFAVAPVVAAPAVAETYQVVYSFKGPPSDGLEPFASLLESNGILYGTTVDGGWSFACGYPGCGTIFSLNPSTGAEAVVYSFIGSLDGNHPQSGLTSVNEKLYGTASQGGAANLGTIFDLKPATSLTSVA
jgi:uncharacterized repeat protein (TIGR03803 family)